MKRVLLCVFLTAVGHYCEAAKQVDSPNGDWTLKTVLLKTLTGDNTRGIGLFPTGGSDPATIVVKTLNYVNGVTIRWSEDSTKVVVAERYPRSALITAAWFDGGKWHSTIQEDRDVDPLLAKAEELGSKRRGYKTQTAELGKWIAPDTIEVHGVLGYRGYPNISYWYNMQIVPGTYPVSGVLSGGYEVGALKFSDYHVEPVPAAEASRSVSGSRYVLGQSCTLTGQLTRSPEGTWFLKLKDPISIESDNPNVQGLSGVSQVRIHEPSAKASTYLLSIVAISIKVNGSLVVPAGLPGGSPTVELVLSDETVKAMEAKQKGSVFRLELTQ
jgi:hypothetical protein